MSESGTTPEKLVANLVDLLTVEKKGEDDYVGSPVKGGVGRVFGGQVIAQALQAAQESITDDKVAHSLHAYFLRGGEEGPPIDYHIERDFDGRSFANRRVVASQIDRNGQRRPILNLTASFQRPEEGLEHQAPEMPDVPPPEELVSDAVMRKEVVDLAGNKMTEAQRAVFLRDRPVEMRTFDELHWMNKQPREPKSHSWFRTVAPLPSIERNAALHRAVIAYMSDYTLLGTSSLPHGVSWMRGELVGASLDHAVWFHHPAPADEWLLFVTESPWTGAGRGFNRGHVFDRDGNLVASVAQEGMMRPVRNQQD